MIALQSRKAGCSEPPEYPILNSEVAKIAKKFVKPMESLRRMVSVACQSPWLPESTEKDFEQEVAEIAEVDTVEDFLVLALALVLVLGDAD
jgi:hypothetical protein